MNGNVPSALSTSMGMEKKPFTHLPGGIDFSELKSPKMQKESINIYKATDWRQIKQFQ